MMFPSEGGLRSWRPLYRRTRQRCKSRYAWQLIRDQRSIVHSQSENDIYVWQSIRCFDTVGVSSKRLEHYHNLATFFHENTVRWTYLLLTRRIGPPPVLFVSAIHSSIKKFGDGSAYQLRLAAPPFASLLACLTTFTAPPLAHSATFRAHCTRLTTFWCFFPTETSGCASYLRPLEISLFVC